MFIYLIRNSQNGRCYIGKTARTVPKRWLEHLRDMRNNHKDGLLYEDLRAMPLECFVISTLYETDNQADLNAAEKRFIEAFRACETGYNATPYTRGGLLENGSVVKRKRLPKVQRMRIAQGLREAYREGRRDRVSNYDPMQATA
jgi:group I intron endonuclease